jgi:hypothetical protein
MLESLALVSLVGGSFAFLKGMKIIALLHVEIVKRSVMSWLIK